MKKLFIWAFFAFFATLSGGANAQESSWIQIEAQPSLRDGQARARAYAGVFQNVNGFSIGSGWYAIALGPFTTAGAEAHRIQLRQENLIPRDSFVVDGAAFRQQFWPIGADTRNQPPAIAPTDAPVETTAVEPPAAPLPPADETPREARKSENLLSREDRKLLQVALQWDGFYNSSIDGAFGRGTRGAMADYQAAMGYDETGILTTKQRDALMKSYNAILEGIGLAPLVEQAAGIEIDIPTTLVEFDKYEPPFVHFRSKGDDGVRVLLISQVGDKSSLLGLYDIMQTLAIVPTEGARNRRDNSFTLTGQDDKIHSYTYAALKGGMVKGFTLIWPTGDEKRRNRVIETMKASFKPFGETALDDSMGEASPEQRIDLMAGLEIRTPSMSRSGFYVDAGGRVLTTIEVVQNCKRISLDETYDAEVTFEDETLGIALLRPLENLSPLNHANFRTTTPRINAEIAVSGYAYEGALGASTMTFGRLADIRGLKGEAELRRLAIEAQAGDAGGPIFDMTGSVLGMMLPKTQTGGQRLPNDVSFAISAAAMGAALAENGVTISASQPGGAMTPEDLSIFGTDMTVLVSCW